MRGGSVVLVGTNPRLPGLLGPAAWQALWQAARVCVAGDDAIAAPLRDAGVDVLAAEVGTACVGDVWLAGADAETLHADLASGGLPVEVIEPPSAPGEWAIEFVEVMDLLRRRCPWKSQQTHESLVKFLIEESYEVVEAIENLDDSAERRAHLCEELGDLLLQVVFHARIAAEHPLAPFDFDDVVHGIVTKLRGRQPQLFESGVPGTIEEVEEAWQVAKAAEKQRAHPMDGIAPGLPALMFADKVVSRALRSDLVLSLPTPEGVGHYDAETLGDVLFALVAAGNAAGIDPEQALRDRVRRELDDLR